MSAKDLFSAEELAAAARAAAELQAEVEEWARWLDSPEGREWGAEQAKEVQAMAAELERACAAGEFALTAAELEQLQQDGILVKSAAAKWHAVKRRCQNVPPLPGGNNNE